MIDNMTDEQVQNKVKTQDVTKIIEAAQQISDKPTPHDDQQWEDFYWNVVFTDDVNQKKVLDKDKVIKARMLEMDFFKKMGVLHLKSMGEDLGIVLKPLIRSDASAALGIAYRGGLAGKTRHVQVQYLGIQQEVANEHVKIQKVLGTDNPADALTKFLPEAELERHMAQMDYVYKNADLRVERSTTEFPAHPGVEQETQIFQQAHRAGSFSM